MIDLEDLIEDTIDDVIEGVRKEKTGFDNSWLPTHEFELDHPAFFVKYVGYNVVIAQDVKHTIYVFTADDLELQRKLSRKFKIIDAFGSDRYICLSLDKRNLQFLDRSNLDVIKQVRTNEQIMSITFNEKRFFQCCGLGGYRLFFDTMKKFRETESERQTHDILSAKSSLKFGDQFGLQAEDEIFTDIGVDQWIKVDEERQSFYKFQFVGEGTKVTPVRLKGLDFQKIRFIIPSPYFTKDSHTHIAYMDSTGNVELVEVEVIEDEFNEGLRLGPFDPSTKLLDIYGADNMETIGQCMTDEVQKNIYLVGLRTTANDRPARIWLKHYQGGILNNFLASGEENSFEAEDKMKVDKH